MGYLTNDRQRRLVRSEEYQNAVAQGIYDGVVRFRSYMEEQRPQ
jgi:N-acetylmuramoyl-L-alanine amidase